MKRLASGLVLALSLAVAGTVGTSAEAQSRKEDKKEAAKTAKHLSFETYKDNSGEWRFRIKDADGNNLAMSSKGYEKKADMEKVVKMIQEGAAKAKMHEEKDDKAK